MFPQTQPACCSAAVREIDEKTGVADVVRRCTGHLVCAQAVEGLKHLIAQRLDIEGLGDKQIELFFNSGWSPYARRHLHACARDESGSPLREGRLRRDLGAQPLRRHRRAAHDQAEPLPVRARRPPRSARPTRGVSRVTMAIGSISAPPPAAPTRPRSSGPSRKIGLGTQRRSPIFSRRSETRLCSTRS